MTHKDVTYLIQYKGGGYDGCFWEWNYCVVRSPAIYETSFLRIADSGYHARKSVEDLRGIISDGAYVYDCNDNDDMKDFIQSSEPSHVKGVLTWLYDELGIEVYPDCPVCKHSCNPDEMVMGGYHGDGGIGIVYTDWHCLECDSIYTCDECESYDETTQKRDDENDDDLYLCDNCWQDYQETQENERIEFLKMFVSDNAWHEGHVLSQWCDYYDDTLAIDCINCHERFTLESENFNPCNKE